MEQFCVVFFITEGNFFFDKPDLKKKQHSVLLKKNSLYYSCETYQLFSEVV